jgi:hypothetical protein
MHCCEKSCPYPAERLGLCRYHSRWFREFDELTADSKALTALWFASADIEPVLIMPAKSKSSLQTSEWADIRDGLGAMVEGGSAALMPVPEWMERGRFMNNLKARLHIWKETAGSRWSIKKVGGLVRIARIELK